MFLIIVAGVASAQSTVTLEGQSYTLKAHPRTFMDGPSGTFVTSNAYSSGLPSKVTAGNNAWGGMLQFNTTLDSVPYSSPANIGWYENGEAAASYAMEWYSDNTKTAYLTNALYLLNHAEQFFPLMCDETGLVDCNYNLTSYSMVYYINDWLFAYELVRSQMTTPQRQVFADKILNDIAAFGGVDGSPSTSCTNPTVVNAATITSATSYGSGQGEITTSTNMFGGSYPIQVGYEVINGGGSTEASWGPYFVVSVVSPTQAIINTSWSGYTGPLTYRRNTWQAGDCGWLWMAKHERYNPQVLSYVGGTSAYPQTGSAGGTLGVGWTGNNAYGQGAGLFSALFSLVDDDVNATQRSQYELTLLYNDWYTNGYQAYFSKSWTGYTDTGGGYAEDRPPHGAFIDAILQNSVNGTPPAVGGKWDQNLLYQYTVDLMPPLQAKPMLWGQNVLAGYNLNSEHLSFFMPLYFAYRSTQLGKWFNWAMQNRFTYSYTYGTTPGADLVWTSTGESGFYTAGTGSSYAHWIYGLTDPTFPSLDMTTAGTPTAVALNQVDASSGQTPQSVLVSRTGYSSVNDTMINFFGMYEAGQDHNQPCLSGPCYYPGDYRIMKGNYLLAPDGGAAFGGAFTSYGSHWWNAGGAQASIMEIGGAYNYPWAGDPLEATMPRANADGTNNRYAYAMVDSSNSYVAGVGATRVQRHLIDFKEGQQFIFVYDDAVTSGGEQKQTYLHYPNNETASGDTTKGNTILSAPTIASSYPGTGNGDADQLLTKVLSPDAAHPAYVYVNNSNGTYTGGNGDTFRVSVCSATSGAPTTCDTSNTEGQFIVVHEPVAGTSNTLPSIELLSTIDANHVGAEVDGGSPKIAVFAKAGALTSSAAYTTGAYSGTAQHLIAGMAPGTYAITDGSGSTSCTVAANDDTCYFESVAGPVSVGLTLTIITVAPSTATVPAGTGSQQFTATCYYGVSYDNCAGNPPSWSSSNTGVATINSSTGLATAGATAGSTTITATIGAIHGTATLSTQNVPTSTWMGVTMNNVTIK